MCWNAEVSLESFILGSVALFSLSLTSSISLSTIILYSAIICMQLVEYVIWTYGKNPSINFYTSIVAAGLLFIQPIASILTVSNVSLRNIFLATYIGIGALYELITRLTTTDTLCDTYRMYEGAQGHLVWNWLKPSMSTTIGLCMYFFFLLVPSIISKRWDFLVVALVTLLISLYGYYKYHTWGSMWCWTVNIIVIIICVKHILIGVRT